MRRKVRKPKMLDEFFLDNLIGLLGRGLIGCIVNQDYCDFSFCNCIMEHYNLAFYALSKVLQTIQEIRKAK